MDLTDLELRLHEVLGRWERRLEAAADAWERLPRSEQRRLEIELELRGETEEWVLVLFSWWQGSTIEEQALLSEDIRFMGPILRGARDEGLLAGPDDQAVAARHLLEAVERMEGILGVAPHPGGSLGAPG